MTKEIWKWVEGYVGLYKVSSLGRVKRIAGGSGAIPGHIKRLGVHTQGYLYTNLSNSSVKTTFFVHRLVCVAFHGPANGKEPNHKDGNKQNNRCENLEWVTKRENIRHACDVLKVNCKKWKLINPSGDVFIIYNLEKFCRDNKLGGSAGFSTVASGRLPHYKGWKCERLEKDLQ